MRLTRFASPLLLIAPLTLGLAQNPPPAGSAAPTLQVYSRETIVDVTVTDAKGNPVHGLTRADFTIKEDNKPQPIRSFEEFGAQAPPAQAELPPHVYTNLQPPTSAVNILLLDGLNSAPIDSAQPILLSEAFSALATAKNEARKYLRAMPPGIQVAILGLSSLHLKILQGFTSNRELLVPAIDGAQIDLSGKAFNAMSWCAQRAAWNEATIQAFEQIAAYVSGIKGKKNLIWLTAPNPTLTDSAVRASCLPDPSTNLHKAYDLLMAAQVSVDPVDIEGVLPATPAHGEGVLSLEAIAEATGGTAYYNTNDLANTIATAIKSSSSFYTLSYVPPGTQYDGRHHTINVTVDHRDTHLVYRDSYYAEDPAAIAVPHGLTPASVPPSSGPPDMRVQMTRGMSSATDLLFDVRVEATPAHTTDTATSRSVLGVLNPRLKDKPLTRYAFDYSIPGQEIALPKLQGGLEFDLAAYDADGNVVTSLRQAIKLNYTPDEAAQLVTDSFLYTQQLDLPPGKLFIRIGVLDRTSNKLGTLEIPLTVPKPSIH